MHKLSNNMDLEQNSNSPYSVKTYEISGKKYKVISRYAGTKNINIVIRDLAIKQAYADLKFTA